MSHHLSPSHIHKKQLTICTVTFNSRSCVDLNWALTTHLNKKKDLHWLIIENSGATSDERIPSDDQRFVIVEGVPCTWTGDARGSYHHAAALNKALQLINTRYVLFLDPDFFVVREGWIQDLLAYMQARNLSFFGAPYHPARCNKYRYFPCGIFLLVDLGRVQKAELDFTPEICGFRAVRSMNWMSLLAWVLTGRKPPAAGAHDDGTLEMARCSLKIKLMKLLLWRYSGLLSVGSSRDVGYRVYRSFCRDDRHLSECLVPVWVNPLYARSMEPKRALKLLLARWIVPDSLSPYPKRKNYAASASFRDFGLADITSLGWEEYMWKGEPFAFHVRGLSQGLHQVENGRLQRIVFQFMGSRKAESGQPITR